MSERHAFPIVIVFYDLRSSHHTVYQNRVGFLQSLLDKSRHDNVAFHVAILT